MTSTIFEDIFPAILTTDTVHFRLATMEFPEARINLSRLTEDTLKNAFIQLTGNTPREGSFEPDEKTLKYLRNSFDTHTEIVEFLRLSIACHVWMTEKGEHPTHTPFYVNSHLFSDKRLELLGKHEQKLKEKYGDTFSNPDSFHNRVYADVFGVESEYYYSAGAAFMQDIPMDWEMVSPTLYWILASRIHGRFEELKKSDGLPEIYKDLVVRHNGKQRYLREAWPREVRSLNSDKKRLQLFEIEAARAFTDARKGWATTADLIHPYKDDMGRIKYTNTAEVPMKLLNVGNDTDLPSTEKKLFTFAKDYLENKRGIDFSKKRKLAHVVLGEPEAEHIAEEDEEPEKEKLFEVIDKGDSGQEISPVIQDLLSDD